MLSDFHEALAACKSLEAVRDVFKSRIATCGYTACACGAFVPTDSGPETHFFFQDWPPAWIELYAVAISSPMTTASPRPGAG